MENFIFYTVIILERPLKMCDICDYTFQVCNFRGTNFIDSGVTCLAYFKAHE